MDNAQRAERLERIVRDERITEELTDRTSHLERHAPTVMPEDYADYAPIAAPNDNTPLVYSLGRLVSDTTESNEIGYFSNESSMKSALAAHIMENSMSVATLFSGRNRAKDTASDTKSWSHGQDIGGYTIQRNPRTGSIRELRANATRLIMRQAPFDPNGIAMRIVTFFPTLDDTATAYETGRDLRDAIRQTKEYREATPLGRTFFERCCDPQAPHPEVETQYVPYADTIAIPLPGSRATLTCRTQRGRMIIETLGTKRGTIRIAPNPGETGQALIQTLNKRYPSQMLAISDMKDRFDVPYDPVYDKRPHIHMPEIDFYPQDKDDEFGL